jgi:hypothetical protein
VAAPVASELAFATATTGSVEVVAGTSATAEIVVAVAGDHGGDGKKGVKLSGAKLGTGFL